MKLDNIDLLKLQTGFMRKDKTTQGMCAALTPELQKAFTEVVKCLVLPLISLDPDKVSDELLDKLAYDLHIDWYDSEADKATKVKLIQNSDKVHSYQGTPYAVEEVLRAYFGEGSVEEWFEYGGDPYHFQINIPYFPGSEIYDKVVSLVNAVKNKRSVLDALKSKYKLNGTQYTGSVHRQASFYTIV